VNENLPDKREFGAFFIRANPFANQPGESALEYSMTRVNELASVDSTEDRDLQRNALP